MSNTTNHAEHYRRASEHLLEALAAGVDTEAGNHLLGAAYVEAFAARRAAYTNAERLVAEALHEAVKGLQRTAAPRYTDTNPVFYGVAEPVEAAEARVRETVAERTARYDAMRGLGGSLR